MGLTAGLVPPRVDASVKAGLLALVAHAVAVGGWSLRRAAATLGIDHVRVLRWQTRAALGRLDDAKPGPDVPAHALLDWERDAICKLAVIAVARQYRATIGSDPGDDVHRRFRG